MTYQQIKAFLADQKKLRAEATQGEWKQRMHNKRVIICDARTIIPDTTNPDNAVFIASAANNYNALLDALDLMVETMKYYEENACPLFTEYVGEYPAGGHMHVMGDWNVLDKALSDIGVKLGGK